MRTILTEAMARLLLLPALVLSIALLVQGYEWGGGGFGGGTIAAVCLLLQYVVFGAREADGPARGPYAVPLGAGGLLLVYGVAFVPLALGAPLLTHRPAPGAHVVEIGTLELHTAMLFDAGLYLVVVGFGLAAMRAVYAAKAGVTS